MRKKDIYFAVGVLVVIGIFIFLAQIGRKPKPLSNSPQHAGLTTKTEPETCWTCHAPDATVKPMPEHHPKKGRPPDKTNCFICHKPADATTALLYPMLQSKKSVEEKFIWRNPQQK